MSGNLNYIKSLQKSLLEMRKKQKFQEKQIKRLQKELAKKEKKDIRRKAKIEKLRKKEDLQRRKESKKNLRKMMRTRGYWNKESNRRAKEQFENENKPELRNNAKNFKEYRLKNLFSKTIEQFVDKNQKKIVSILSTKKKVLYALKVTMSKGVTVEGKKRQKLKDRDHHLRPPFPSVIMNENDKLSSVQSLTNSFNERLVDLEHTESGWKMKSIDHLDIKIVDYDPIKGGCLTHKLPIELEGKRCIVQMESKEDRCFRDAIHLLENSIQINKFRVQNVNKSLNWENIIFPVSEKEIEIFEKNNLNTLVYVYGYENKDFYIFYKNKDFANLRSSSKISPLLFYKNHFYPIVNLKAFHKIIFKSDKKYHVCFSCLANFSKEEELVDHYSYCQHEFPTRVKYPNPNTFIKFNHHSFTLFHPFVCYLDIESCLQPINEIKGSTYLYQKHVASTFGLLFIDYVKNKSEYKRFTSEKDLFTQIKIYLDYISSLQLCMNNEERNVAKLDNSEICDYCKYPFLENDPPVKDHSHFSGKYRCTIHQSCNLKRKDTYFLPIFVHNMMRYDEKLFIRGIDKSTSIIAKNLENFISFQYSHHANGKIVKAKFVDSYKFLSSSLSKLIEGLDKNDLKQTRKYFKYDFKRKGVFPYDMITDEKVLDETTTLPPKERFFNTLTQTHISNGDYKFAKQLWEDFHCKRLRDYMNIYLQLDVCQLADIFEKFRKSIYDIYQLDPAYYITIPSLAQDCALKYTNVKLECISDPTMYNFIEFGIRGGVSMITKRYAKANSKLMKNYNPNLPSSYIIYLDANNLYGFVMTLPLPVGDFRWVPVEDFDINQDCIVDVDISIPKHLYKKLKDYPLCSRKENNKLSCTLYPKKNYVCHSRYLKEILSRGYIIDKINKVLSFRSEAWLKSYIEKNTELRKLAVTEFEKSFWKLMNNSVFGKQIENVRKRIDIKMIDDMNLSKLSRKQNFEDIMVLQKDQYLVQLRKKHVLLNKPIYGGQAILDFSKIVMSEFYYDYIQPKFGERYNLLMTDTDSFLGLVQTEDFYKEISSDLEKWFDTSNLDFFKSINKKVPGKFKDEMGGNIITEFVGLGAKQYSYKTEYEEVLKCKGITKQGMKEITFEDYKKSLDGKIISTKMNVIKSRNHEIFSETILKKVLDPNDDKRKILENGIDTIPWGYE